MHFVLLALVESVNSRDAPVDVTGGRMLERILMVALGLFFMGGIIYANRKLLGPDHTRFHIRKEEKKDAPGPKDGKKGKA